MKPLLISFCILFLAGIAFAKHPESAAQTLAERYDRLSCAVVQITFKGEPEPDFSSTPTATF